MGEGGGSSDGDGERFSNRTDCDERGVDGERLWFHRRLQSAGCNGDDGRSRSRAGCASSLWWRETSLASLHAGVRQGDNGSPEEAERVGASLLPARRRRRGSLRCAQA